MAIQTVGDLVQAFQRKSGFQSVESQTVQDTNNDLAGIISQKKVEGLRKLLKEDRVVQSGKFL